MQCKLCGNEVSDYKPPAGEIEVVCGGCVHELLSYELDEIRAMRSRNEDPSIDWILKTFGG